MQLTNEEETRVETALAMLPRTFAPVEGDAIPLGPNLLISSGYDLLNRRSTGALFTNAGEIVYLLSTGELYSLKHTGQFPSSVPIPTAFDERGHRFLADWIHELS